MSTGPDELAASLADVLSVPLAGAVEVRQLRRLSGGASRVTWSFEAVPLDGRPAVPLVFQQQRPGGTVTGGGASTSEARLLRAARAAGVPVADVVVAYDDPSVPAAGIASEGPWMVMAFVDGEAVPRRIFRDPALADVRPGLAAACGVALAAIHRIPPDDVLGLEQADRLARQVAIMDELGEAHPAFELGVRWLEANRPPPTASPRVVHGDFRTGNLLIGARGLHAVLDWELAHLGDPVEDLGWFCVRAWRFGSPLPAGGFGTREQLVDAYEGAGGERVDRDALRWWEVMGTFTWGVICMVQAATHRSGLSRSVELAAIGRRVCETEHDLLALLP